MVAGVLGEESLARFDLVVRVVDKRHYLLIEREMVISEEEAFVSSAEAVSALDAEFRGTEADLFATGASVILDLES